MQNYNGGEFLISERNTWNNLLTWGLVKWLLKQFGLCSVTEYKYCVAENLLFFLRSSMNEHCAYINIYILSLFKVDKNHNSLLFNKHRLIKYYNHMNYLYPTSAINFLHKLHGQPSQLHNFILLCKFLVMKNLLLPWVLFAITD